MPSRTVFFAKRIDEDYVIDIFDFIGKDWFGEGITGKSIAKALASASDAKRIVVRLNSPGGETFEGTTIYNLLRSSGKFIRVEIHGLAASMASIIALAGDEVLMADGSLYMIHNPWGFAMGESEDMKKTAALLEKVKSGMLDIYSKHANVSREKLSELMDEETWMDPTEAIKMGFVDGVIAADEEAAAAAPRDRTFATLSRYAKTPAQLLSQLEGPEGIRLVAAMREQPQRRENKMEREAIIAALGLKPDATDDEILAAAKAKNAPPSAGDMVPRADYEALRAQNEAITAQREKEKRESFEATVNAAIDGAVKAGKIPPVSAEYHRKACMKGEDALKEFRDYIAHAPVIASNEQMEEAERQRGGHQHTAATAEEEKKVLRNLGITAQELAAAKAEIREDEENYPPEAYRFAM